MSESRAGNIANGVKLWSRITWCRIMAAKKLRLSITAYVKKADISYQWLDIFIYLYISFISILEIGTLSLILQWTKNIHHL